MIFGLLQARDRGRLCWQTKPNYVPDWSKGHYDGVSPPGWRGSKFAPLPEPPTENTGTTDTISSWRKDCTDSSLTSAHLSSWQSGSLRMMHDSGVGSGRSSSGPGSSPPASTISSPSSRNSPGWRHITGKSAPLPPIPPPSSLPLLTCPPSPPPLPPSDHLDWGSFAMRRNDKLAVGDGMIPPPLSWRDKVPHPEEEPPPLPPRPNRPVEAFWEAAGPGTGTHFLSAAGSSIALPDDVCPGSEDHDRGIVPEPGMVIEPGSSWLAASSRRGSNSRKDENGRRHHHHRRHHHNGQHSNNHHQHHHRRHFSSAGLMPALSPTRHQEEQDSEADEEVSRLHQQRHLHLHIRDGDTDLDSSIDTDRERVNPKFAAHTPPPPTPPPAKISPPQRQLHNNQRHQVQTLYPAHKLHMYKGSPSTNSSSSSPSSGAQDV